MNFRKSLLTPVLFILSLAGCLASEPAVEKATVISSYVIKPNDVVALAVFNEASLSTQTRVLQTGEAMFPLVGPVKIGGLNLSDAMEKLRSLYDADYLVDPKLTLAVNEYAVQQVLVLGSVRAAGQIPIPSSGKLDIAAAIAAAGGLSETADPDQVFLRRADGQSAHFTFAGIERSGNVTLAPGDRIIVNESRFVNKSVTFVGEVRSRGSVAFPMDGELDIVTAIARAGGFTELANPKKASINRKGRVFVVDVKEMSSKGGQMLKLQPDDIITIPERMF